MKGNPKFIFPPAPVNGGPLQTSLKKIGRWVWQPKIDDWRGVIHIPSGTAWNQYGKPSSISSKFQTALTSLQTLLPHVEYIDCGIMENRHDMMRGSVIVFDLMNVPGLNYQERRNHFAGLEVLPLASELLKNSSTIFDKVYLIGDWCNVDDPMDLQNQLLEENKLLGRNFYEGLVAKKYDAEYPQFCFKAKTTTPNWIKHRFDLPYMQK